jgi:polar amino acid transport system substrate-binding protein
MRAKLGVCTGLLWALSLPAAWAQQTTFTIGVEDLEYYPQYSHTGNQVTGFGRELLDAFAKSRGYKFEYRMYPLSRLSLEAFKFQSLDFKYPDNRYWETKLRKQVTVHYSDPVMPYIDGVLVLPENKGRGIKDFRVLGTMTGFTPWNYLDMIKEKRVTLFENDSFISLLKQVSLKRVDGAYVNIEVGKYQLREVLRQPDALVFDPALPHIKDFYYLSSVKHPAIIREFNQFLAKEKDLYEQIRKKLAIESSIHNKQ